MSLTYGYKMDRNFYLPRESQGRTNIKSFAAADAVIYTYDTPQNKPGAMVFHGKAAKPDWHYIFNSIEHRDRKIAEYIETRKEFSAYKARTAEQRKQPHTLKVGDILVCSWGYDQTNIDFYQVTRVPGPHTVEITPIKGRSGPEEGFMTAYKTAVKDAFCGEPMIKKCNSTNSVYIASYASAGLWDGKPERYSWYA